MANFCTQRIKLFVGKEELKRRGMKAGRNQIASEEFRRGAAPEGGVVLLQDCAVPPGAGGATGFKSLLHENPGEEAEASSG